MQARKLRLLFLYFILDMDQLMLGIKAGKMGGTNNHIDFDYYLLFKVKTKKG